MSQDQEPIPLSPEQIEMLESEEYYKMLVMMGEIKTSTHEQN